MKRALLGTLPGRAIVAGLAINLVVYVLGAAVGTLPPLVRAIDTVAASAVAAGGAYLLVAGLASAKRRLLWRVRRKLIISYIFIGFVPAILIVAFFLLGGLFLFSNFSSYLLQMRLRNVAERAQSIGEGTALEIQRGGDVMAILVERQRAAEREFPGASIAVVPVNRRCPENTRTGRGVPPLPAAPAHVGAWVHVQVPTAIPQWIDCNGFKGLLVYGSGAAGANNPGEPASRAKPAPLASDSAQNPVQLRILARAAAFPDTPSPSYAVVVDLPINDEVRRRVQADTGVWLSGVTIVEGELTPLAGTDLQGRSEAAAGSNGLPVNSASYLESRDWTTGAAGELMATTQGNVRDIYDRISAGQGSRGQDFKQGLLLVLLLIGFLLLFIQFVALVAGLTLAKSITGSVHELFVGTERVRQADFTHKISVKTDDQLGELAESFNSMTASIEDLLRQAAEKKRLEEELRIAHEIQMSLLPQGPLRVPGLSVTALCVPAREVGGDYYDFLTLDEDRLALLIADVSGKGTSAALYMAELKGLVLSLSRTYTSPRALLIAANRLIAEHLDSRSFITITYAVVDLASRTMTYARAGHTPLIYVPGAPSADRQAQILAPDGLVLGLKIDRGELFERLLEEDTIQLGGGDVYVFFTDGISEAMNDRDDCFGEQRLGGLIEAHADLPADELRERVLREVEAFVGTAPQHDDMTMILLKIEDMDRTPNLVSAQPAQIGGLG